MMLHVSSQAKRPRASRQYRQGFIPSSRMGERGKASRSTCATAIRPGIKKSGYTTKAKSARVQRGVVTENITGPPCRHASAEPPLWRTTMTS